MSIQLEQGSLLVLGADTNALWQHSVEKDSESDAPRVSVTLRYVATFLNMRNGWILGQGELYQDLNFPHIEHSLTTGPVYVDVERRDISDIALNNSTQTDGARLRSSFVNRQSTLRCVRTERDSHFHAILMTLDSAAQAMEIVAAIKH